MSSPEISSLIRVIAASHAHRARSLEVLRSPALWRMAARVALTQNAVPNRAPAP